MAYKTIATLGSATFMLMLMAHTEWDHSFFMLVAIISIAWLLLLIIAFKNAVKTPSVNTLLKAFRLKVDHARQQQRNGLRLDDHIVLEAFDELEAGIKRHLEKRKVDMPRLKRDVMTFLYPAKPQGFDWRPPSLIELGYLLYVCKRYVKDAPVLAVYQLADEIPDGRNVTISTFRIMRNHSSLAFPPTITIGAHASRRRINGDAAATKVPTDTQASA